MNQYLLKNIYDALGSTLFRYNGQIVFVSYDDETGEYRLVNKY